jgi:hypothetical protein
MRCIAARRLTFGKSLGLVVWICQEETSLKAIGQKEKEDARVGGGGLGGCTAFCGVHRREEVNVVEESEGWRGDGRLGMRGGGG